jgi:hypothetical protein
MPTQLVTKLLAYKRHVLVMHHMSRVTMSHKGLNGGSAKISGCSHTLLHMLNTQAGDLAWHLTHSAHHHRSSSGPEAHGYSREPVVTAPHQHHPRALSMRCHPHTPPTLPQDPPPSTPCQSDVPIRHLHAQSSVAVLWPPATLLNQVCQK